MCIIVLYESICQSLNSNISTVKNAFLDKVLKKRFFIFYNKINFYKKAKDQQLHNKAAFINYITGYIYFMNILSSVFDSDNNWYKWYLNTDQVNKKAINALKDKNLKLDKFVLDYRSETVYYITSKVLNRYFGQTIL